MLLMIPIMWEGIIQLKENSDRSTVYQEAQIYADSLNKPLLVVGGPLGGKVRGTLGIRSHGYGDVCIDIDPGACIGAPEAVVGDIRSIPYSDKYFGAVFVSHVLEHLPTVEDCEMAIEELNRVADKAFLCVPSKASFFAWFVPDHHLWITESNGNLRIEQR